MHRCLFYDDHIQRMSRCEEIEGAGVQREEKEGKEGRASVLFLLLMPALEESEKKEDNAFFFLLIFQHWRREMGKKAGGVLADEGRKKGGGGGGVCVVFFLWGGVGAVGEWGEKKKNIITGRQLVPFFHLSASRFSYLAGHYPARI